MPYAIYEKGTGFNRGKLIYLAHKATKKEALSYKEHLMGAYRPGSYVIKKMEAGGRSSWPNSGRRRKNPATKTLPFYEVLVGNIGKVWEGSNGVTARITYHKYVKLSKAGSGRAGGEDVTLWKDNEIIMEHYGNNAESNPGRGKWMKVKAVRVKNGVVQVRK